MGGYEEFRKNIQKLEGQKNFKITGSYGVYDAYKAIRKEGWKDIGRPLTEHEFYSIIRGINSYLAEEIALGHTVCFPKNMGKLELRKAERGVSMVDGKLKITYPVDWDKTLKLWYKDAEAKKNKTLLRTESPLVYHVRYCKGQAKYKNKTFYKFQLNRAIKKQLMKHIKEGLTDTMYKEY